MKKALRRKLRAIRDAIPQNERDRMSGEIREAITLMPEYAAAKCVLLYFPISSEPDIIPLADQALACGKTVAFPVVKGNEMAFLRVSALDGFITSSYGIPEPDAEICECVTDFSEAICVVPALAVDEGGNRIGYGGGCYDRFLSGFPGFSVCAVFPQLSVKELPCEAHDVKPDAVVIPGRGVRYYRR